MRKTFTFTTIYTLFFSIIFDVVDFSNILMSFEIFYKAMVTCCPPNVAMHPNVDFCRFRARRKSNGQCNCSRSWLVRKLSSSSGASVFPVLLGDFCAAEKLTFAFGRTKHKAQKLCEQLGREGYAAGAIHGNRSQAQREQVLIQCTAVKGRGTFALVWKWHTSTLLVELLEK